MYSIIYEKDTRKIVKVIDREKVISYSYTPNCAEMIVENPPPKDQEKV